MEETWEPQFSFDNGCTYTILTDRETVDLASGDWAGANAPEYDAEKLLREVRTYKGFRYDIVRRDASITLRFLDLTALSTTRVL